MGHSKSLRTYDDVRLIFDRALTEGAIAVVCKSGGQAINLRARLNHFRSLDRESMAEVYPPGDPRHGVSPYDIFVVRILENTITIEKRDTEGYTIEPLHKTPKAPVL